MSDSDLERINKSSGHNLLRTGETTAKCSRCGVEFAEHADHDEWIRGAMVRKAPPTCRSAL